MKKISILILVSLISLSLISCNARSVSVIGGADGPTSIIVGKNQKRYRSEKEPVRTIMINGSLYYDTGEDNDIKSRSDALDGSFIKAVDKWELPKNDNEANFGYKNRASAYQLSATKDIAEVPIGDDWEIFKKIEDPEKDFSQYKYILKVEGDTQYQHGESEYIILSNSLDITANDVAKSGFSSDSKDFLDIYIVDADF